MNSDKVILQLIRQTLLLAGDLSFFKCVHFADKTARMLAVLIQLFDEPAVSRDRAEAEAAAAESQEELK
jgi:hypothetical protein